MKNCTAEPEKTNGLAQAAYHAYGDSAEWRNFRGDLMPGWLELPEATRQHWIAAVGGAMKWWLENIARKALKDNERVMAAAAALQVAHERNDPAVDAVSACIGTFLIELIDPTILDPK